MGRLDISAMHIINNTKNQYTVASLNHSSYLSFKEGSIPGGKQRFVRLLWMENSISGYMGLYEIPRRAVMLLLITRHPSGEIFLR